MNLFATSYDDGLTCQIHNGMEAAGIPAESSKGEACPGQQGRVDPYLVFAEVIAAGLHGIEQGLELPAPLEGNGYESRAERSPATLREAIAAPEGGRVARTALGDEVVDHYPTYGPTEQRLFDQVVTFRERERLFERG